MHRTAWVGLLAFLADRLSKQLASEWLQPGASVALINGALHFTYTQNTGMAFSILADRTWLLIVFSMAALVLLTCALRRALNPSTFHNALLWLLLAGGIGNLADRLFFGYVVDFIHIQLPFMPVFNVADMCLTASAALLAITLVRSPGAKKNNDATA